jgi:hypothetical protein
MGLFCAFFVFGRRAMRGLTLVSLPLLRLRGTD